MALGLRPSELSFLARQGLSEDDVFDVRGYTQDTWFCLIDEARKTIALGSPCRKAGHRLRSRRGHCVQCDTSKLAFAERHGLEQYVYIAGSLSARLLKVGTCKDIDQRFRQICFENHGQASDWIPLYYLRVPRAGEVEARILARLSEYAVPDQYWKNGQLQTSIELVRCSYSRALQALSDVIGDTSVYRPTQRRDNSAYEFTF